MTRDAYAKARVFQPQLCKLAGRYGTVRIDSEMSYIVRVLSIILMCIGCLWRFHLGCSFNAAFDRQALGHASLCEHIQFRVNVNFIKLTNLFKCSLMNTTKSERRSVRHTNSSTFRSPSSAQQLNSGSPTILRWSFKLHLFHEVIIAMSSMNGKPGHCRVRVVREHGGMAGTPFMRSTLQLRGKSTRRVQRR